MKVDTTKELLSKSMLKIRALYFSCINCRKQLDNKRIAKYITRCKKCERDYAKVWPSDNNEFYKMFDGQH